MARTVFFAVKALERRNYCVISEEDYLLSNENANFQKSVISSLVNSVRANRIATNNKTDNMIMAHEYFKRAIVTIVVYSFFILITFVNKSNLEFLNYIKGFIGVINTISITGWNIIFLYVLIGLSFLISILIYIKLIKVRK